jgi:hypothetical protein
MEELHTDNIDGGHEGQLWARSRARERAYSNNKAQGQSLQKVGIDLRQSVFIHGQFYVAFSRVTDVANLDVLLPYRGSGMVENIVYPEVLLR